MSFFVIQTEITGSLPFFLSIPPSYNMYKLITRGEFLMRLSIAYEECVVKELIASDRLLQFRLNLILTKEKKSENEAYISIFKNEIMNDVFRLQKYMTLLQNKS